MNCKKCGAELAENAKFCTECGTSVAMVADTVPTEEVKEEVKQETEEVKAETTETKEEAKEESVEKVEEVKMAAQEETAKVEKAEEIKTEPTPMMTSKPKQSFQLDKKFVDRCSGCCCCGFGGLLWFFLKVKFKGVCDLYDVG